MKHNKISDEIISAHYNSVCNAIQQETGRDLRAMDVPIYDSIRKQVFIITKDSYDFAVHNGVVFCDVTELEDGTIRVSKQMSDMVVEVNDSVVPKRTLELLNKNGDCDV